MSLKILIGCDPEVFVHNPASGTFISGHGLVPGDKYNPFAVPYGAVQVDGCALEFNTDPADNADQFVHNVFAVFNQLKSMTPGYELTAIPAVEFEKKYWRSAVPEIAKELGCEPDFCGWTGRTNKRPNGVGALRTGSGHVHIGWGSDFDPTIGGEHYELCCEIAKQMDYYLGMYSVLWDPDPTRRTLYGKAGAFRPKSYGIEYRVMSNAWLNNPLLARWIFNAAKKGAEDFFINDFKPADIYENLAQTIIDTSDMTWPDRMDLGLGLPLPPKAHRKAA